jgi:hypothetical protein
MELNLKHLKGLILSPGNIFWIQKSGSRVLISAKEDFLNCELIEKLFKNNDKLLIENSIDYHLQHDFLELLEAHSEQILVREKGQWREAIIELCSTTFASPEFTQFEINQSLWVAFSNLKRDEAKKFLEMDIALFKRSLSIASNYTLCAFLLGYYDDVYLKKLFNETFVNLMSIEKIDPLPTLKEKLENIRETSVLSIEDKNYLEKIYKQNNILLSERYDGTGVQSICENEMTELELVLVALCNHYPYGNEIKKTLFCEINEGSFFCEKKTLNRLKRSVVKTKEREASLSA